MPLHILLTAAARNCPQCERVTLCAGHTTNANFQIKFLKIGLWEKGDNFLCYC